MRGLNRGDLDVSDRVIVCKNVLVGDGDDICSVRSVDSCDSISYFFIPFLFYCVNTEGNDERRKCRYVAISDVIKGSREVCVRSVSGASGKVKQFR